MRVSILRSTTALATAFAIVPLAGAAKAQDIAGGPGSEDPEIVVTGSLIRGTPEDAAQPVDTFRAEDLEIGGVSSPLEFIKDLPQVGGVLGDTNQFSSAAQGRQGLGSINLRGLGPQRTLVLFNGRRTLTAPGAVTGGFGDTNTIPLFALDRIEILKDGAAATYGSDAIAGVANFVSKRNFNGVEIRGDYDSIRGSDGNWTASVLAGADFGALNLMAGVGWQHRSELSTLERPYGSLPYDVNPSGWSALATPGTFVVVGAGGTVPIGPGTFLEPDVGCNDLGGVADGVLCRFSFMPFNNLVEEEDRYQGYIQADIALSDTLSFHMEGTYAQTDIEAGGTSPAFPPLQGPGGATLGGGFSVSPNNPGVAPFVAQNGLTGTPGFIGVFLWRPFGWLGNPLDEDKGAGRNSQRTRAYRVSGGFEKELSDSVTAQFDLTYMNYDRRDASPGIVGSRLQAALNGLGGPNCTGTTPGANGCLWLNPFANAGPGNPALGLTNPFYVPGAENSQDLVRWLQVPNGTNQKEQTFVADLIVSGEMGLDLGAGPIGWAIGAQYRKVDLSITPLSQLDNLDVNPCVTLGDQSCLGGPLDSAGSFIFLGGSRPQNLEQSVKALFAEVLVPVTDRLELSAAARFEDYGGSIGSTFNPKGAIRWEATDWLVLRGTIGSTFRAPVPTQVSTNAVTSLVGLTAANGNFKAVDIAGNPVDLGPETALTYNLGAVVDIRGLNFSVDYWSFDFKGEITPTDAQAIANNVVSTPGGLADCSNPFASLIVFDGAACVQGTTLGTNISRIRTQWVNGPDTKTTGLDFQVSYTTDLGAATLTIGGNASHILTYKVGDFTLNGNPLRAGFDAVGLANLDRQPGTIAPWRANGYVNVNVAGFNARYGVQYIDGVTDERCPALPAPCATTSFGDTNYGREIPSFTQHDAHFAYDLPISAFETQLQFSIENFTNAEAPAARVPLGYNPFTGNPLGRVYRLGAKVNF